MATIGTLKVKIFDGKASKVIPVEKSTATVGSNSHCDVVLEHSTVQGEHVRAWLEGGRIWIQDLGTASGSFLNGIRLPVLKPMLVRDLDVLKLGECPAMLGLEAVLVRAPIVRTAAQTEEITLTDINARPPKDTDLEKRREDLAKVSRELAEMKLQLQMGRLEKESNEELRRQVNQLREELRVLAEEREGLEESIERVKADRRALILATEEQVVDMKRKAEREIQFEREQQNLNLKVWKADILGELKKQVASLTEEKARAWVTRPLSQDMVFEWEGDLTAIFQKVLTKAETAPKSESGDTRSSYKKTGAGEEPSRTKGTSQVARADLYPPQETAQSLTQDELEHAPPTTVGPSPLLKRVDPEPMTGTKSVAAAADMDDSPLLLTSRTKARRRKRKTSLIDFSRPTAFLSLAALGCAFWLGRLHFQKSGPHAGQTNFAPGANPASASLSSSAPSTSPPYPPVRAISPGGARGQGATAAGTGTAGVGTGVGAAASGETAPTRAQGKSATGPAYFPTTKTYKKTYTDNVLFTQNYGELENNAEFKQRWYAELQKAALVEWHVDEKNVSTIAVKETQLIQDLQRIKAGIQPPREQEGMTQMHSREGTFRRELQALLRNQPQLVDKFMRLKRIFFGRNRYPADDGSKR